MARLSRRHGVPTRPVRSIGIAIAATLALLLLSGFPGVGLGGARSAGAASATPPGVLLPNGRLVTPAGSNLDPRRQAGDASYDLGDFPLGLALSPDGRLAVASLNGVGTGSPHGFNSFCEQDQRLPGIACPGVPTRLTENPATQTPDEGLDVVDLQTGKVMQTVAVPTSHDPAAQQACGKAFNCFGMGLAFSPDGKHLYATGGGQDAIYDYAVQGASLHLAATVPIPSPSSQMPGYPIIGGAAGYPRAVQVAKTSRGLRLVVANEFDSTIELFDVAGGKAPKLLNQALVPGGIPGPVPVAYLYDVAVSPDGSHGYVTAQGTGVIYTVDLALFEAGSKLASVLPAQLRPVAPAIAAPLPIPGIDHPTGIAVSPDGRTLAVTGTNSDNVAFVPLVAGLPVTAMARLVHVSVVPRSGVEGAAPDAVAWSADGRRAYAALAGDDAVAVIDTASVGRASVVGYVPTGWYPTAVGVGPTDGRLYTVAAKGLGSRYVPGIGGYTPAPGTTLPSNGALPSSDYYDAENMPGLLQRVAVPNAETLASYSSTAALDVLHAGGLDQRPADSPIPVTSGGDSPIKHVVYIVRENRTFDQVFGDLGLTRKDVDADPYDQVLAPATPNAHAIASRYAIGDHFFSDGEASVQGHWWTSSAASSDYIEKSWRQYYSPRGRPGDSAILPVTTPPGCSIFQDVQRYGLTHPAFSYRNYGELVGSVDPNVNAGALQRNLCRGGLIADAASAPVLDPKYPTQAELVPDDRTRASEFLKDSGLTADGSDTGTGSLRNFNYLILSEDHTSGLAGKQTPRSEVAQNDAALGQIVSGLSKSKYWSSTAVFVVEDDSQDGVDHIDGHRNVLLVASPWTKHASGDGCSVPGYIGHSHYDQAGVLRTIELILGLQPLSAYDSGAAPLYDLFQPTSNPASLTAADLAPYQVAGSPSFIDETVASLKPTPKNAALKAYSRSLDVQHVDAAEPQLESVLWQSVRDDPLPNELAAKVGGAPQTADKDEAAQAAGGTAHVDSTPVEVRPGAAPNLSSATGAPLAPGEKASSCPKRVAPAAVAPGQTALLSSGAHHSAGVLDTGPWGGWWLMAGPAVVALALALQRILRRHAARSTTR